MENQNSYSRPKHNWHKAFDNDGGGGDEDNHDDNTFYIRKPTKPKDMPHKMKPKDMGIQLIYLANLDQSEL